MAEQRLEEIRQARLDKREKLLEEGSVPYPAEAKRSHTTAQALADFEQLSADKIPVTLVGRIMAKRGHGSIAFADLRDGTDEIQLQFAEDKIPAEIFSRLGSLDAGDFLEASGHLITNQRGAKTLEVLEFHLLSKSIRPIPSSWHGLKDHETRFRNREVDLLMNKDARDVLVLRDKVIGWLRNYLHEQGYLEVETPILQSTTGGAAAKPFKTHHNTLDMPLHLRIAAELNLKRMLVAGFEKVFEIERRFRNEGISPQHNPEFTMLEAQWAYADYEDLMDEMEKVLENLSKDILGTTEIQWQGHDISLAAPFKRVSYVELVSKELGVDILEEKNVEVYKEIFRDKKLELPKAQNYYQLVDELYKELIRPNLIQPTLLYDYPAEMAPLAKRKASDPRIAEKFQLLIGGLEINNSYTELNDPVIQRQLMEEQQAQRDEGDEEAQEMDEEYLKAMEQGMPPNVGWGIGIDRLVMILADVENLRDTIAFPLLKPKDLTPKT